MGEMNKADLRGNELPFLILFEIGQEGTPRQIFSNIRHNFSANELASATVQSFEHKKWNPLYSVMFVSPQKHTVTREGHEVRDSVSENISKEEGRRQERLRHAHNDCMR